MSDRVQRVLDVLMDYDEEYGSGYPLQTIYDFFNAHIRTDLQEYYDLLTVDEEKQLIEAFLEFAY